ncbi:hypothetical protein [Microscilla marina]|nr:hypothetical protein [Microscilla marina]
MKTTSPLLTLTFCLVMSTIFAQKTPFFHIKHAPYSKKRSQQMKKKLKKYEAKLSENEQLKIVRGILTNKLLKSPIYYNPATFGKPNKDEHMAERLYWVLDFDQDKTVDLVLIFNTYFGPTPGYYFYFNHKGKFEYVYDNAGQFVLIRHKRKQTFLQHAIFIIDEQETQISQTFVYNHTAQSYVASPKLYYASQSKLPKKIALKPSLVTLTKVSQARYSPQVDDTPAKKIKEGEYNQYKATKTLWGNVVAKYAKGAKGYVLATQSGWAFVAFLPDSKLIKTSLRHGMDEGYDQKNNQTTPPKISPYICGWIPQNSFR